MRQRCIAQLAPSTFRVVEVTARPETLREADEVLICNALMPLVRFAAGRRPPGPRVSFTIF